MRYKMTFLSCDAIGTSISLINGIIAFLGSSQSKWGQHDFIGHVMPLAMALVSYDANGIINGTTAFLRWTMKLRHRKTFLVMWCLWHHHYMMPMASSVAILHTLGQDGQNEVQHHLFSCHTHVASTGIINGTIAFLWSRQSNWDATWLFGYDMPKTLASYDTNGIVNGTWHWGQQGY